MCSDKLAGLEALCERYRELGIDASILPENSPEAVQKGIVTQDVGYIKVRGLDFDLVTMRVGPMTRGSYSFLMGRSAMSYRQKLPFAYHHIVRTGVGDDDAHKARLKKRTRGILKKEVVGVTWQGGSLAATLTSHAGLNRTIVSFLSPEDRLEVIPDRKNGVVRVVFARPVQVRATVLRGIKFDGNLLPGEAIDAINQIAGLIR